MKKVIPRKIIHLLAQKDTGSTERKKLNMLITSTGKLYQYTVSAFQIHKMHWVQYHCITQYRHSGIIVFVHLNLTVTLRSLISNSAHIFQLS